MIIDKDEAAYMGRDRYELRFRPQLQAETDLLEDLLGGNVTVEKREVDGVNVYAFVIERPVKRVAEKPKADADEKNDDKPKAARRRS